jgi:hypothetical protein
MVEPLPSFAVADSWTLSPTVSIVEEGVIDTEETLGAGSLTVMLAVPSTPWIDAVIVVLPALRVCTAPLELTEATAELALLHDTGNPLTTAPFESTAVACS